MNKDGASESHEAFLPAIRRARFDRLTIYEVEESELVLLERGGPDSIYLTFAVALVSIAASLTVSLASASITSQTILVVFVVACAVGYVGGALLVALWWQSRRSVRECVQSIRKRLPTDWSPDRVPAGAKGDQTG